jgi:peptidoglycan/xylan/chitin deacetylase (PgdA/CDA1 family)
VKTNASLPAGRQKSNFLSVIIGAASAVLILLGGLLAFGAVWTARAPRPGKRVLLVFRYDDYSRKDEHTGLEVRLLDAFGSRRIPCTFGVIPYVCTGDVHNPSPQMLLPLSEAKARILRKAATQGLLEVAQHGYSHQTSTSLDSRAYAEFVGLPLREQLRRLKEGRELLSRLSGQQVSAFVPPWNAYDLNTLKALERCRFVSVSAGRRGPASVDSALKFLPATCGPADLRYAVALALASPDPRPTIVVLFHAYDFREVDSVRGTLTLPEFARLLDWVPGQTAVRASTISGVVAEARGMDASHYLSTFTHQRHLNLLPYRLARKAGLALPTAFYPSSAHLRRLKWRLWIVITGFYTMVAALTTCLGCVTRRRWPFGRQVAGLLALGVGAALTLCVAMSTSPSTTLPARQITIIVALFGANLGWWIADILLRKRAAREHGMVSRETSVGSKAS